MSDVIKILVVDDECEIREILTFDLRKKRLPSI